MMNSQTPQFVICRMCAAFFDEASESDFHNLFIVPQRTKVNKMLSIWKQINSWNLKINSNDGLPQNICTPCYDKLLAIAEYRKTCEDAQKQLNELFTIKENNDSLNNSISRENFGVKKQETQENSGNQNGFHAADSPMMDCQTNGNCTEDTNGYDLNDTLNDLDSILASKVNVEKQIEQNGQAPNKVFTNFKEKSKKSVSSYVCKYCYAPPNDKGVVFNSYEELSNHLFDVHNPNSPYNCSYCSEQFRYENSRQLHVLKLHSEKGESDGYKYVTFKKKKNESTCTYCKEVLTGPLEAHEAICSHVGNWQCEICSMKFTQIPLYKFRLHKNAHALRCKWCARTFIDKSRLERHTSLYHSKQSEPWTYPCGECGVLFPTEADRQYHELKAHNVTRALNCVYCQRTYVSQHYLEKHMMNFHADKFPSKVNLSCNNCGAEFNSIYKLRYHKHRPRDENGRCLDETASGKAELMPRRKYSFECEYCPKKFSTKTDLMLHQNMHNKHMNPFSCRKCPTRCSTEEALQDHIALCHNNKATYECEQCGKRFCYKKDLLQHAIYHSETKVHCSYEGCDFLGRSERAVTEHVRNKHLKVPCKYCGEQFVKPELKVHVRNVHSAQMDIEVGAEELHPQVEPLSTTMNHSAVSVQYYNDIPLPADNLSLTNGDVTIENHLPAIMPEFFNDDDIFIGSMRDPVDNETMVT